MATLTVTAPFTVQLDRPMPTAAAPAPNAAPAPQDPDHPDTYVFPVAGTYDDVPDDVAAHWYTAMHLEGYEPPAPSDTPTGKVKVMTPREEAPAEPRATEA